MTRDPAITRWLIHLTWPGAWILLAIWAFQQEELALAATAPYAIYICFGALGAAALVSWYFNYGRVFFVVVAAGLTVWVLQQPASNETQKLAAVSLLPLNFALFALLKERGIVSLSGILRMGLILAQVVGVVALQPGKAERLEVFLRWGQEPAGWTWLPFTAQVVFAAAIVAVLALVVVRRTKAEQDLLWVLIAAFAGLYQTNRPEALFFYFGAAGLILVLGVLERGHHIAYRDELTGLPGRRALNEMLAQVGSNYAIAMCDVDHFKKFNDTFGHDAGDQVLRMVASKLTHVGGGGRVFRYGGEEFAVVFRGRSMQEVQPLVESLRAAIAGSNFTLRRPDRPAKKPDHKPVLEPDPDPKNSVSITVSVGVAAPSKRHSTPELVLDAADNALYRAKQSGRNCVVLAEDTPS
ncbi:MAG: diguanylate cyclase [Candidatus Acidiferrales bacterium]